MANTGARLLNEFDGCFDTESYLEAQASRNAVNNPTATARAEALNFDELHEGILDEDDAAALFSDDEDDEDGCELSDRSVR
jgi:hypothetical protein